MQFHIILKTKFYSGSLNYSSAIWMTSNITGAGYIFKQPDKTFKLYKFSGEFYK